MPGETLPAFTMTLTIAVQMDPLESISIAGDSTFALMLEAQRRGHRLIEYQPGALTYDEGRVRATGARPVTVQPVKGDHFSAEPRIDLDLGSADVVLMRQDPPFDIAYVTATYLLERLKGETLVVNDPASVRDAPEKLFVLDYARFMPPTMITRSLGEVRDFLTRHGDIVLKPLHGKAGEGVFRIGKDGANLTSLAELFGTIWKEPFIAQAFLPDVSQGDKRIILVDGEPVGAINRIPGEGEIRSNLAAGGSAHKVGLTGREEEICAALAPALRERGLFFVGIDVIAGYLTEINVTSPTGMVAMDQFNGTDTPKLIWDKLEAKLAQ